MELDSDSASSDWLERDHNRVRVCVSFVLGVGYVTILLESIFTRQVGERTVVGNAYGGRVAVRG